MSKIVDRAPGIARDLVAIWGEHMEALDEAALPYLDALMDAVLTAQPMRQWQLVAKLCKMVPITTPGTISRMAELKFGQTGAEVLGPSTSA